jgi:FMN-dependent NADH-azoreductase
LAVAALHKNYFMKSNATKVLKIDSSARFSRSHSRLLTNELVKKLAALYDNVVITERDLYKDLPFVSELMIASMYTPPDNRTAQQADSLAISDVIIHELKEADILVLGVPMYNFAVPACLKAWIDLMVRTGLTYKLDDTGFKGLLENKRTYVVITSNGIGLNSEMDFVSGYLKCILGFVGINDVHFIDATKIRFKGEEKVIQDAMAVIGNIEAELV